MGKSVSPFFGAHRPDASGGPGTGYEDVLTEAACFYLSIDTEVLQRFVALLTGEEGPKVKKIESQWNASNGKRPDIRIELEDGSVILVENKVRSGLGRDRVTGLDQLETYLALGLPEENVRVALLSERNHAVAQAVLDHPRYLNPRVGRPRGEGIHFYWRQLHDLIPAKGLDDLGIGVLRHEFREYLSWLGNESSRLSEDNQLLFESWNNVDGQKARDEFGASLQGCAARLRARGFKTAGAGRHGFSARPPEGPFDYLGVEPAIAPKPHLPRDVRAAIGPEILRVQFVFKKTQPDDVHQEIQSRFGGGEGTPFSDPDGGLWHAVAPYTISNRRNTRLEYITPIARFLERDIDREALLERACMSVITRALSIIEDVY